jgi:hypothetical protein
MGNPVSKFTDGRSVVLDLNDQGDVGFRRELEMFF